MLFSIILSLINYDIFKTLQNKVMQSIYYINTEIAMRGILFFDQNLDTIMTVSIKLIFLCCALEKKFFTSFYFTCQA